MTAVTICILFIPKLHKVYDSYKAGTLRRQSRGQSMARGRVPGHARGGIPMDEVTDCSSGVIVSGPSGRSTAPLRSTPVDSGLGYRTRTSTERSGAAEVAMSSMKKNLGSSERLQLPDMPQEYDLNSEMDRSDACCGVR